MSSDLFLIMMSVYSVGENSSVECNHRNLIYCEIIFFPGKSIWMIRLDKCNGFNRIWKSSKLHTVKSICKVDLILFKVPSSSQGYQKTAHVMTGPLYCVIRYKKGWTKSPQKGESHNGCFCYLIPSPPLLHCPWLISLQTSVGRAEKTVHVPPEVWWS